MSLLTQEVTRSVRIIFQILALISPIDLATDGAAEIIIIFSSIIPTTSCRGVIPTHVSRVAPD